MILRPSFAWVFITSATVAVTGMHRRFRGYHHSSVIADVFAVVVIAPIKLSISRKRTDVKKKNRDR